MHYESSKVAVASTATERLIDNGNPVVTSVEPPVRSLTTPQSEREITVDRPGWTLYQPPVISRSCLRQLRMHGEACALPPRREASRIRLHDPTCGVVTGQAAAFYAEDTVLGSATITTTFWDRSARSGTARTDGRGA